MTKPNFSVALSCVGGGPNPSTDHLFAVKVDGEQSANYATRAEVEALAVKAANKAMDAALARAGAGSGR